MLKVQSAVGGLGLRISYKPRPSESGCKAKLRCGIRGALEQGVLDFSYMALEYGRIDFMYPSIEVDGKGRQTALMHSLDNA